MQAIAAADYRVATTKEFFNITVLRDNSIAFLPLSFLFEVVLAFKIGLQIETVETLMTGKSGIH